MKGLPPTIDALRRAIEFVECGDTGGHDLGECLGLIRHHVGALGVLDPDAASDLWTRFVCALQARWVDSWKQTREAVAKGRDEADALFEQWAAIDGELRDLTPYADYLRWTDSIAPQAESGLPGRQEDRDRE